MSHSAVPDVPAHFQTFLSFDFGSKRTGVAFAASGASGAISGSV